MVFKLIYHLLSYRLKNSLNAIIVANIRRLKCSERKLITQTPKLRWRLVDHPQDNCYLDFSPGAKLVAFWFTLLVSKRQLLSKHFDT